MSGADDSVAMRSFIDTPAIGCAFSAFVSFLDKSGPSFSGSRQTPTFNHYCNFLDGITEQIFGLFREHSKSKQFREAFTNLLVPYGYRASTAAWVRSSLTQQKLTDLANVLKEDLKDPPEELRSKIIEHIYRELVTKAPNSVVTKAEMFNATHDMILVRGPTQYGKTLESVLTAWRAYFDGERLGEGAPACATFCFVRHSNADITLENLKRAVIEFNDQVSKEIWTHFSYYASLDLAKQFQIRVGTSYLHGHNGPQLVLKRSNVSKLSQRVVEAGASHHSVDAWLLFDDEDDSPPAKLRPGELPPPEVSRTEILRRLKLAALPVPTVSDDENAKDIILAKVAGSMMITSTPETLLVAETSEKVNLQKLDMLADAPIKADYYGYDKRLADDRRPKFVSVESDWERPAPVKAKGPRRPTATAVAPRVPKLQYTGEGLTTLVKQVVKSSRTRHVLVFTAPNPENPAQGSIEETQSFISNAYNTELQQSGASERGAVVVTYCGGAKDQDEAAVAVAGWKYRGKISGSKNVLQAMSGWFAGQHDCTSCNNPAKGCGHCAARQNAGNVVVCTDKDGEPCVVYNRKVHLQDVLSMINTCLDELETSRALRARPHVVIVSGKAGIRRVSYRNWDGAFFLTDLYMSFQSMKISAAGASLANQLLGRLCFTATNMPPRKASANDEEEDEGIKIRIWCSKPVRQNVQALLAAGECLWKGTAEESGMQDAQALGLAPPTGSPYAALNVSIEPKAKQPFAASAILTDPEALMEKLTALQEGRENLDIRLLSALHVKKERNVHKMSTDQVKDLIKSWFPQAQTIQCNFDTTQEAWCGSDPGAPTACSEFWADIWYHVQPNEVVIIEHTVPAQEIRDTLRLAEERGDKSKKPLQVWHRFRQHTAGRLVELVARTEDWSFQPPKPETPTESVHQGSLDEEIQPLDAGPSTPSPPASDRDGGGGGRDGSEKMARVSSRNSLSSQGSTGSRGMTRVGSMGSLGYGPPSPLPYGHPQMVPPMMVQPQMMMTPAQYQQQYQKAMMRQASGQMMHPMMQRQGSGGQMPMPVMHPMPPGMVGGPMTPQPLPTRSRSKLQLEE